MSPEVRPLAELIDVLRSPHVFEDLVIGGSQPLVVVDASGAHLDEGQAQALRALPLPTVAVSEDPPAAAHTGLAAFDVLLVDAAGSAHGTNGWVEPPDGVDAALDRLADRIAGAPLASATLVQLLRISADLDVVGGLVAESLAYSALQGGAEFGDWLASNGPFPAPVKDPEPLSAERRGAVLEITFTRPGIHNAFGFQTRDALVEALQMAAADPSVESIVITGEGRSFCSGGDLREFGTSPGPAIAHRIRTSRSAGYWVHRLADRVSVHVHGACIGAGVELAAFASRVEASADSFFELPEVGMGLVPGAGGTVSMPRRIGRHRTAWLALTGERLDAASALRWGLVDRIVDGKP
ncbi:MAG: enoyl-CoA hydratase/isomerase family protein [Actinobacteria bacterium]|nr:MAG: enoyl-CoA hydratase/isomerase family protein [Actinomycetota bacterium]RIK05110.1 MAG: hypothetical protein DCC48_10810 [Acidobacteriota bacterium]